MIDSLSSVLQVIVAVKQMALAGVGALVVLEPAKLGHGKHELTARRNVPAAAPAMVGIISERGVWLDEKIIRYPSSYLLLYYEIEAERTAVRPRAVTWDGRSIRIRWNCVSRAGISWPS